MSSREVKDAVGAAPERLSAAERLAERQSELQRAEQALEVADDFREVARLRGEVAVLREFVASLRVQAAQAAEAEVRSEARALVDRLRVDYEGRTRDFGDRQAAVEKQIRAAGPLVAALYDEWTTLARTVREVELLSLRFGLDAAKLAPPPAPPNLTEVVFDADVKAHLRRLPQPPVFVRRVSDTPDDVARETMRALGAYLPKALGWLSPEARALFERCPVPDLTQPESQEQREARSARTARAAGGARHGAVRPADR